ncbi:hypothetical protein CMI39_01760 [Candidatus Pacearchaeota archaeon]|jgi:hypothetical protein|nr:hypothetical protein [Candidatus Pacearchaeota archaeon]|tara:strand:+ start:871 stop:1374 length:504 start_codon:yes stop_codon:yes gene_type:complete
MNFQFYLEKLHDSEKFKEFKNENKDAYLCSGFFILDKTGKGDKSHLDFYIPSKEKMFSFQLEDGIKLVPVEILGKKVPEKILEDIDFNFEDMEKLINEEMEKENIKNKVQKIMFSLQKLKGKEFLVGTVFITIMGLLKVNIDINIKKITDFEKKSFLDMMNITGKRK